MDWEWNDDHEHQKGIFYKALEGINHIKLSPLQSLRSLNRFTLTPNMSARPDDLPEKSFQVKLLPPSSSESNGASNGPDDSMGTTPPTPTPKGNANLITFDGHEHGIKRE